MKLDEVDFKIIEFLKKDARTPFTEIGEALGLADSTVHLRAKKLIDEGIITKFTISVNEQSLGKVSSLLMMDVVPGTFEDVARNLMKIDYVEEILELQGPYVAQVKISANNLAEMREEILKIRKISNVTRTEMITILKDWKTT